MLDLHITPDSLILIAIFLLVGFPVHEFAHAFAAYRLGDSTAKWMGRLTLNPIAHFDRIGGTVFIISVLFFGFAVGWAKPTPVNVSNLRDRKNSEVVVSLAGPAVNLLLACAGAIAFRVLAGPEMDWGNLGDVVLISFVYFNLFLMLFNLIPVPPLDGSSVLFRFLPPETAWRLRPMLTQYGMVLILLGVLFLGNTIALWVSDVTALLVGV